MENLKSYFIILSLLFIIFSCQKDELSTEGNIMKGPLGYEPEGLIELGDKIEDPYKIGNMRKALISLQESGKTNLKSSGAIDIQPTHLYIRFLPQTLEQLELLRGDTALNLFGHPLDYEIREGGSYYLDPNLPEGALTSYYGSIPVEAELPKAPYELIYECYIPDTRKKDRHLKSTDAGELTLLLEEEAFKITGNLDFTANESPGKAQLKASWEYPKGTFRVSDHTSGEWDGVSRVRIKIWRLTNTTQVWTDEGGNYESDKSYKYSPNYKMQFESRDGFKIWGNWAFVNEATYDMGQHANTGLSRDIARSSGAWKWCTVNNGLQ